MSQLFACRSHQFDMVAWLLLEIILFCASFLCIIFMYLYKFVIWRHGPRSFSTLALALVEAFLPCRFSEDPLKLRDKPQIPPVFALNCNILSAVILQHEALISVCIVDGIAEDMHIYVMYTGWRRTALLEQYLAITLKGYKIGVTTQVIRDAFVTLQRIWMTSNHSLSLRR